jgi:growth factor-regulated tyrosine kinase substrate
MPLPHLGIVQPVRVCETCYEERNLKIAKSAPAAIAASPAPAGLSTRLMQPRSARVEDDDDKDLKMALQMSLEEAKRSSHPSPAAVSQFQPAKSVNQPINPPQNAQETDDEDLKAAIAASLKDMEVKKAIEYPPVQVSSSPQAVIHPSGQYQVRAPAISF